jgi:hemolysin III
MRVMMFTAFPSRAMNCSIRRSSNAHHVSRRVTGAVAHNFPQYTDAETSADRALHLAALPAAIGAVGWLFFAAIPTADIVQAIAYVMYGCGLIGMLAASAAYNLCRPSHRKELLRRIDHAMIFVMIAGTYTPFTLYAFGGDGLLLCLSIWALAAIGIAVTLAFPRRFERLLLALYLIMGWTVLGMGRSFILHLSNPVLCLLLAGGAAYSIGAFVHARCRFRFHNVVWHAFVLLGAGLHWAAVAQQFAEAKTGS